MACFYTYNDHVFNSELELDQFLLEKEKFIPTRGDAVFSETVEKSINIGKIEKIKEIANKLDEQWNALYAAFTGETEEKFKGPYIGVSKFLSGRQSEITGKYFYPEFRNEEFWSRKFAKWRDGDFSEESKEDLEILKITPETAGISDLSILDDMRKKIEEKWDYQARVGTEIHKILEYYFGAITKPDSKLFGQPRFLSGNIQMNILKNFKYHKTYKDSNGVEHKSSRYIDDKYLTEELVKQVIKVCDKIRRKIEKEFGNNDTSDLTRGITYFPELKISSELLLHESDENFGKSLMGMIDLLILDSEGTPQIIDYKTSPHSYANYDDAKKHTIRYLLATYRRMLNRHGIDTRKTGVYVVPMELVNIAYNEEEKRFIFDSVNEPSDAFYSMTSDIAYMESIEDNLDEILPKPVNISVESDGMLESVDKFMKKCFPNFGNIRNEDEYIEKSIKKNGGYQTNEYGKKFVKLSNKSWSETFYGKDEKDIKNKIKTYFESGVKRNAEYTNVLINQLEKAMKNNSIDLDLGPLRSKEGGDSNWLNTMLGKYCNNDYTILRNEAAESLGVILIRNKISGVVDVLRVTNKLLNIPVKFETNKQAKNLLGLFENDIREQTNKDSLMLKAINGNVILMETMAILNNLHFGDTINIGNVLVIKPKTLDGISATNDKLVYCFDKLTKKAGIKNNITDTINMLTYTEQAVLRFRAICDSPINQHLKLNEFSTEVSTLEPLIKDGLLQVILNKLEILEKLTALAQEMETKFPELKRVDLGMYSEKDHPEKMLYEHILLAIAELRGVKFGQQLKDSDKFYDSDMNVLFDGISGTRIDNPGMQNNEILNLCTKITLETYLNIRDEMLSINNEVNKRVIKLKQDKNFGFGNLVSIYSDMIIKKEGDLYFKNPFKEPLTVGNDFLIFALDKINRSRYPNLTDTQLLEMIDKNDPAYFRVPLLKASDHTILNKKGILGLTKERLMSWNPARLMKNINDKLGTFLSHEELIAYEKDAEDIYRVINYMDNSKDPEKRLRIIDNIDHKYDTDEEGNTIDLMSTDSKLDLFETDIEKILLSYAYSESLCRNFNEQMPLMKAASISLALQGRQQGGIEFTESKLYIEDYIKNKIKNESLEDKTTRKVTAYIEKIKGVFSKLALGYNVVMALFLPIESIWKDISLIIRKPDGTNAFSKENMMFGFKTVWADLFKNTGPEHPTLCLKINELLGVNDMDMNQYVDRIKNNREKGFNYYCYKFTSRPDFYNRMSLIVAQMKEAGCWDAHSIKDGELIYDMTKDTRFGATAKQLLEDPKYRNSKERLKYLQYAEQMIKENTKVIENGKIRAFKIGDNLPRALTNQEAESFKNICDLAYGYYTHEKKALVQSTMWGGMALQMKTYLTAKKNQFLGAGGIKVNGHFEQLKNEEGKLLYYALDKDGNVDHTAAPVTEDDVNCSKIAFELWLGNWQEGILCTMANWMSKFWETKSWELTNNAFFGEDVDPNKKRAYKLNFTEASLILTYAIIGNIIAAILGGAEDEMKKNLKKNPSIDTALLNSTVNILFKSINNSFLDYNVFKTFGETALDWRPFSGNMALNMVNTAMKVMSGDLDVYDALVNSIAATRQFKPVFLVIKPEFLKDDNK